MPPMTLLSLYPEKELEFPKAGVTQGTVSRKLTLTNSSTNEFVAFKVKTTAPKSYLVRPSSGVLQGKGASQEVQIILQPAQAGQESENHRFLVQAVVVSSGDALDRQAWSEKGKDEIQEQRLNVAFTEATGGSAVPDSAAAPPRSTAATTAKSTDYGGGTEDLKAKYDELVQYTLQLEKDKQKYEDELSSLSKGGGASSAASAGYSRRDIILAALVAFIVAYLTKYW